MRACHRQMFREFFFNFFYVRVQEPWSEIEIFVQIIFFYLLFIYFVFASSERAAPMNKTKIQTI